MNITLVLHNIRSEYNVGAILRTAEGLGVAQVIYSGYTPAYNDQLYLPHVRAKIDQQIAKVALGAEKLVPQARIKSMAYWLDQRRVEGRIVIGLENNLSPDEMPRRWILGYTFPRAERVEEALARRKIKKPKNSKIPPRPVPQLSRRSDVVLFLGEEVEGIPAEFRRKMDFFLEIPMRGQKESFNVSVAAAMALWELSKN